MQFCEECGSLMHADDGEMVCSSCGARQPKDATLSEAYESREQQRTDDVIESDGSVSGGVAGGADSYEFSGELTGFSLDGDATVYLDGQQVDPSTLGGEETPPNYVVIDGGDDGRWTRYEFSVDGAVEKSDEWGSVNGHDAVDGTTVSGWVKDGVDSYRYSGDIGSFDIYGPVDVRFGTDE